LKIIFLSHYSQNNVDEKLKYYPEITS